jgi:hypothetical protein
MAGRKFSGREVSVYLPSKELLDSWSQDAEKYGCSLSKYIFEMVERARLAGQQDATRPDQARENSELRNRCNQLSQKIELLEVGLQRAQTELYEHRFGKFSKLDSPGYCEFDAALVALLRRGGLFDTKDLLEGLGINPANGKAVQLVSSQLTELMRFGLVKATHNGWRWIA